MARPSRSSCSRSSLPSRWRSSPSSARDRSRPMKRRVEAGALHVVLGIAALLTVLPLLWMVSASFMPAGEASALPLRLWPSAPTLEHYRALFARLAIGRHLAISVGLAAATTAVALLCNTLAGYAFAKLPFPGRDGTFRLLLGALVIPGQVADRAALPAGALARPRRHLARRDGAGDGERVRDIPGAPVCQRGCPTASSTRPASTGRESWGLRPRRAAVDDARSGHAGPR